MGNNDVILGYTVKGFYNQKQRIIEHIDLVIEKKKTLLTKTERKLRNDILSSKDINTLVLMTNGVLLSISTLFLSKIDTGSSYVLTLGCPSLILLGSFLVENKLRKDEKELTKDSNIMRSIYAYENLIGFLNGNECSVASLNEIKNVCISDKFIQPLRLLNMLDKFSPNDYIFIEELCIDFNLNNKSDEYVKRIVKDK